MLFVNIEDIYYLIMEDYFLNGCLRFEKVGVFLIDCVMVDKVDMMKVMICFNFLYMVLVIMGCLLGYRSIVEEMKDLDLLLLVFEIGYNEGFLVVELFGIIDLKIFFEEVVIV